MSGASAYSCSAYRQSRRRAVPAQRKLVKRVPAGALIVAIATRAARHAPAADDVAGDQSAQARALGVARAPDLHPAGGEVLERARAEVERVRLAVRDRELARAAPPARRRQERCSGEGAGERARRRAVGLLAHRRPPFGASRSWSVELPWPARRRRRGLARVADGAGDGRRRCRGRGSAARTPPAAPAAASAPGVGCGRRRRAAAASPSAWASRRRRARRRRGRRAIGVGVAVGVGVCRARALLRGSACACSRAWSRRRCAEPADRIDVLRDAVGGAAADRQAAGDRGRRRARPRARQRRRVDDARSRRRWRAA